MYHPQKNVPLMGLRLSGKSVILMSNGLRFTGIRLTTPHSTDLRVQLDDGVSVGLAGTVRLLERNTRTQNHL